MKKIISLILFVGFLSGSLYAKELPSKVRVVIGSKSTGGDTYQASAIITKALGKKLGVNFKVDAVGSSAGFRTLKRVSDGNTIMIFHDSSYLGLLYGKKTLPNLFKEFIIGPIFAINPGNAYAVPKSSPYKTAEDVIKAVGADNKKVKVSIQPRGVSEIGYSALKNAIKLKYPGKEKNLIALNAGSQASKDQQLFDGLADVISASIQANEQYTQLPKSDQKAMRFIWLTASNKTIQNAPTKGYGKTSRDDMLKWTEGKVDVPMGNGKNFTFEKEFFFVFNTKMDKSIIAQIEKGLQELFAEGEIQETLKKSFFIPKLLTAAESKKRLDQKRMEYQAIIDSIK